jgi:hypothetical protein
MDLGTHYISQWLFTIFSASAWFKENLQQIMDSSARHGGISVFFVATSGKLYKPAKTFTSYIRAGCVRVAMSPLWQLSPPFFYMLGHPSNLMASLIWSWCCIWFGLMKPYQTTSCCCFEAYFQPSRQTQINEIILKKHHSKHHWEHHYNTWLVVWIFSIYWE